MIKSLVLDWFETKSEAKQDTFSHFKNLPKDVIIHILSFTDPKDRSILLACKRIYEIGFEEKDPRGKAYGLFKSAAKLNDLELIQKLLVHKKTDACSLHRAFLSACESGQVKAVELLLKDPRVDSATCGNEPLISACKFGHKEVVRILLKDPRVDPRDRSHRAYSNAVEYGHLGIQNLLLSDNRVGFQASHVPSYPFFICSIV